MHELETIEHQPASAAPPPSTKPAKEPRIPANIKRACELLASGECKTQTAAAERSGVSREWLSKMMQRSHVQVFIARKASENIQRGVLRASTRFVDLIDAESEHVAAKVSERLLEHAGILKPQSPGGGINVNISNNIAAGYVLDATPWQPIVEPATPLTAGKHGIEAKPLITQASVHYPPSALPRGGKADD